MTKLCLLGSIELRVAGQVLSLGTPKQRKVLAALAVDAGRPVLLSTLIDRVWEQAPPADPRAVLYAHITRIRRVLAKAVALDGCSFRLTRSAHGYLLETGLNDIDLHRFQQLIDEARRPGRTNEDRARLLGEALDLSTGLPLAGLEGAWVERVRESCRRRRLDAALAWAQAAWQLGDTDALIGRAHTLSEEYPHSEPLCAMLMRALAGTGRVAEALECYATLRRCLADELGVDPSRELVELHHAFLRGDVDPVPRSGRATTVMVPAQLPPPVVGFTGRERELAQLDDILAAVDDHPGAVTISAIKGTAGVGKTALALHWAHAVRDRFPDGQLYVDLRGFDRAGHYLDPAYAIHGFLLALGVPPQHLPADLDALVGLYRSALAERRVLVVLDNARDSEQVRPLLAGGSGSLAIVTSRSQLTGLLTAEGAHSVVLDVLTRTDAERMLTRRLGHRRISAEPHAVQDIIDFCAQLPIALAIVAGRAATHPSFPLQRIAAELRDEPARLDAFLDTDVGSDVRTILSWSYRQLSPEAARLFRLLGLHPGQDISAAATASFVGVPVGQARRLLAELTRAHMLSEYAVGRYRFHDLLRAYAAELAGGVDCEQEHRSALRRLFDHYLHSSHAAALNYGGVSDPFILPSPADGVTPESPADGMQAVAWFRAEHGVLLAVQGYAADVGFETHAWALASTMSNYLGRHARWHDWAVSWRTALCAAQDDLGKQASAHRGIANAYAGLGRYEEAHSHLQHAYRLLDQLGDRPGLGRLYFSRGHLADERGDYRRALHAYQEAHDIYAGTGELLRQARALGAIGWCHVQLGEYRQAILACERAVETFNHIEDHGYSGNTFLALGRALHHLNRQRQAVDAYHTALNASQILHHRHMEAEIYTQLGDAHNAADDNHAARQCWQTALQILRELNLSTDRLQTRLAG